MGRESAKPRVFRAVVIGLGVCVLGAIGAAGGCVQQPTQLEPLQGQSTSSSGSTGSSGGNVDNPGRDLFADMLPDLMGACGTCHDIAGFADTPFLAGPDRYQSFVSWPGIVASTPEQSILLTYSIVNGGHSGTQNVDSPGLKDTLLPKIKAWLAAEAKTFTTPAPQQGPHIEPFAPIIGFNAVYLKPLGDAFEGMAVTFSADFLTDTTLELSDIQVHPTSKAGVHMVHPLFVMYPVNATPIPDPVDSFSNLDQTFDIGKSGKLGPGTVLLVNWQQDARLSVAFEKIELVLPPMMDAGEDAGPTDGCKDVASFDANARGQLNNRCVGCHGGANGQATAALDMSAILQNNSAKACAQVLNRVAPADPPASQIFVTTNPNGNAAHPYKFGGSADLFNTFRSGVSIWIAAEQ